MSEERSSAWRQRLARHHWVGLWALGAIWWSWWTARNPLPDGWQNEYLHVGNAWDLYGALLDLDVWHLRWYMYTGYWPWGFYAVPWPFMALLGPTFQALLAGNLLHLGLLLWSGARLGRSLGAPLAPALLLLCPAVWGCLVRYEPNLAAMAFTLAGLACLVDSGGLRDRRQVLGFGLCLGLGLMMDRLTVGFFLAPAVLPLLRGAGARGWKNLGLGLLLALLLTAAWYREFFLRNWEEVFGQAPVGEIDSAGHITEPGSRWPALYYPLALVDSQLGPILGLLGLWGLGAALWAQRRGRALSEAVLLCAVLPGVAFFTLIAKKQVYYTLPVVGPVVLLAAMRGRWAFWGVVGGLWGWLAMGWGLTPPRGPVPGLLPLSWVEPRHEIFRRPSRQRWPFDEAVQALRARGEAAPGEQLLVYSEDDRLYEGYLALALRERWQGAPVRGLVTDPVGSYELAPQARLLLAAGPPGRGWPAAAQIEEQLRQDNYRLEDLPPVAEAVAAMGPCFSEVGRWSAGDVELVGFLREAGCAVAPGRSGPAAGVSGEGGPSGP